ncbi:MAG: LLM class flavin-dependent oxidoreductase [Streptomycetaceae bacterium]|nr:LLM class flavin-dependent oxidoreductase [Streptomycetaceae bacterium]
MPVKCINFELRHPAAFGRTGQEVYAAALDMIAWADEHGFARVTFGEHHQSPDGYISNPLLVAAAVGGRTRTVRVRISALLAPLYHPLRLAEEAAVADLCLGGRLDLGMAVGYVEGDFDAFGADYRSRGRFLEELVPFLRRAWTGEPVEWQGKTVRVTPRPAQDPMPIYLGGSVRASIDRAARLADGYFPPMPQFWKYYRRACARHGRPDPGELAPRGPIFLWVTTERKEAVWERLAPHIRHQINSDGAWTAAAYTDPFGPFVPTRDIAQLSQGGAYAVVDPDEAIALATGLGADGELHLNPMLSGIAPDEAWRMLRTVEERVLPHLPH